TSTRRALLNGGFRTDVSLVRGQINPVGKRTCMGRMWKESRGSRRQASRISRKLVLRILLGSTRPSARLPPILANRLQQKHDKRRLGAVLGKAPARLPYGPARNGSVGRVVRSDGRQYRW